MKPSVSCLHCLFLLLLSSSSFAREDNQQYRIAIIGAGISGSFTSKYLAEYDVHHRNKKRTDCFIDRIDLFDVSPPPDDNLLVNATFKAVSSSWGSDAPKEYQGSRVSSLILSDGSVIELGASIIYSGNQLVVDMMAGDSALQKGAPMGLGKKQQQETTQSTTSDEPSGFGIYHGNREWLLSPNLFSRYPPMIQSILKPLYFVWRYNIDYFRLRSAVKQAIHAFDVVYDLLNNTEKEVTYFNNPMELWDAIGLKPLASISFHEFLDELGLSRGVSLEYSSSSGGIAEKAMRRSWWDLRSWLPCMGCLRSELVTAMTINTYNQDLNEMNGLVGLVAYVPAGGDLFSVEGGNYKLIRSAIQQAQEIYDQSNCGSSQTLPRVKRHQKTITTVITTEDSMELLSNNESLGEYDIVILAAPMQMSRIKFLMRSPMGMDPSILHEMPLAGVHDNVDSEDIIDRTQTSSKHAMNNEHGGRSFAHPLLPSATTPYTSVVTTIISNVTLNSTHFGLTDDQLPRSILVSERGKLLEGITTLTILSVEKKLVKTFSTEALDDQTLNSLFGPYHVVEYIQKWGGGGSSEFSQYGGATPSFRGGQNSESLPYLLYDGAVHWSKSSGPALYYVNAIESAVAAIEISAIGAKSTAKLVARRLGLISPIGTSFTHEEL